MFFGERQRERVNERETERDSHRDTERHSETERERERKTERERERNYKRKQTDKQTQTKAKRYQLQTAKTNSTRSMGSFTSPFVGRPREANLNGNHPLLIAT